MMIFKELITWLWVSIISRVSHHKSLNIYFPTTMAVVFSFYILSHQTRPCFQNAFIRIVLSIRSAYRFALTWTITFQRADAFWVTFFETTPSAKPARSTGAGQNHKTWGAQWYKHSVRGGQIFDTSYLLMSFTVKISFAFPSSILTENVCKTANSLLAL